MFSMFPSPYTWYDADIPIVEFFKRVRKVEPIDPRFKELRTLGCSLFTFSSIDHESEQCFQFWTTEYLDGLTKLIKKEFPDKRVLEVGAGNGELTHCLQQRGIDIRATDSKKWQLNPRFPAQRLTYTKAIAKYKPDLVIASWIPFREDWTPAFREAGCSYLLIGDCGCCATDDSYIEYAGYKSKSNFKFDFFNICKSDDWVMDQFFRGFQKVESPIPILTRHSRTILFKRKQK